MLRTWMPPGGLQDELVIAFEKDRASRILVLPAWYDEANKLRRFTVQVMRHLDNLGIDSFLPDLPGCNESLAPLQTQTIAGWRSFARSAAKQFSATHVLAIRAGALVSPPDLPGWRYAPQTGAKMLRAMIRARTLAAQEAGRKETAQGLMEQGLREGLTLAGWPLGASMVEELANTPSPKLDAQPEIAQSEVGGPGLWLRAQPSEDTDQANKLAALISRSLDASMNGRP